MKRAMGLLLAAAISGGVMGAVVGTASLRTILDARDSRIEELEAQVIKYQMLHVECETSLTGVTKYADDVRNRLDSCMSDGEVDE